MGLFGFLLPLQFVLVVMAVLWWRHINKPIQLTGRPRPWSFEDKISTGKPLSVGIIVMGSIGDIRAFIAVGLELQRRSHKVCIITDEAFLGD